MRPCTAAQIVTERRNTSETVMTHYRFPTICTKIIAELAYVRPEKPFQYLKEYLSDPEGPVPVHFRGLARENALSGATDRPPRKNVIEAYFVLHDVHPFLEALGEKLVMVGDVVDAREFIREHLDWSLDNIRKSVTQKHFERNQWRLKPKADLSEDDAALKIQSGFRGKRSRKRVTKIKRSKDQNYNDPECDAAAVKMQSVARGRKSRNRVNNIKHKKDMEAMGFTEDHEAAAVEIQKIGRSKRDRKRVKAIREQKEQERQLRELTEETQSDAAVKIQNCARSRKARKRVKRKRDAKRREAEMANREWTEEENAAAAKLQTRQRMKRDKKRVKRIQDAKRREAELESKEWNEEEQAAATKLQTMKRIKRDKQRVKEIKQGSRSAFELILVYKSGSAVVTLTLPNGEGDTGTFVVAKSGNNFCSGAFVRAGNSATLTPDAPGEPCELEPLVVDCEDEGMSFAVQGDDNWMTQQ